MIDHFRAFESLFFVVVVVVAVLCCSELLCPRVSIILGATGSSFSASSKIRSCSTGLPNSKSFTVWSLYIKSLNLPQRPTFETVVFGPI